MNYVMIYFQVQLTALSRISMIITTFFSEGMLLKDTVFFLPPPTFCTEGSYEKTDGHQVKMRSILAIQSDLQQSKNTLNRT